MADLFHNLKCDNSGILFNLISSKDRKMARIKKEDQFELSAKETKLVNKRMNELLTGKVIGIDAYEAIEAGLKKLEKSIRSRIRTH